MKTIVLGPPGTGKTHTLLNQVEDYLKNTDPDRIGYFAFTKKAANEAKSRAMDKFNYTEDDLSDFLNNHYVRPKNCIITMLTFSTDNPSSCGIVLKDDNGVVIQFHEKSEKNYGNCANGAIYAFDNEFNKCVFLQALTRKSSLNCLYLVGLTRATK